MKKLWFILIPLVAFAVYMSKPSPAPAHEQVVASPIKVELPVEKPKVEEASLSTSPKEVSQGDPVLVTVSGLTSTSSIRSFKFNNESLPVFLYKNKPTILIGIDLRLAPAAYPMTLTLTDGRVVEKNLVVKEKYKEVAPLSIPDSLGGNTPESEQELINSLEAEAKIINAIKTTNEPLWRDTFRFPLAEPITITDPYGYSRQTGGSTIAHKGTDFRAAVGTPVEAINDGVVSYVGYLRNYGNVIAVNHGTKLLSIYMHLSKVVASVGEEVKKGKLIAYSGETGYVLGPHLHLTIRINNISIDPMKFMALLGDK